MEDPISKLRKSLGSFCNNLQRSCDALTQSVDRRPIPLDSASSTFIQCLNRRVSSVSTDLNLLESMSFGTVSFEELLGHCNEVYKKNQSDLFLLEERLKSLGYIPDIGIDDGDGPLSISRRLDLDFDDTDSEDGLDQPSSYSGAVSEVMKSLEEDPLMDESLSLKKLGLSDVCLATLASEANAKIDDPYVPVRESANRLGNMLHNIDDSYPSTGKSLGAIGGEMEDDIKPVEALRPSLKASKDNYESLPDYIKSLASWEDLLAAVEKINLSLSKKDKTKESNYFHQDEIASLDLGPKARAYLLLLVRMNHLVVETIDGSISYRVL
ncbi:hypothetical protein HS088_TW05G00476 [Tripterygium wilfordii]|uniref:Spindle and kinetochore-associated protein 3 n=1 Tax=Tripterygium wilfordii TaxID=458696 RepID=A0A7J7DN91_TRIWF|nr:uncharacterized protein LOC119998919 [Tripterygium wilfordii]XP_038702321.1 uncharacterized protein LOC119998919 [Tripterygium wilfordii]KAF5747749.1 hypothetical protein HS088_TW05G00476 [Tripterygium wilfordii]